MSKFRADLHCHTSCSDGLLTPVDLIKLAKEKGLSALSITDHDTMNAYDTAILAAKENNILLGSGIEFSAHFFSISVHVLGYDYDLKNSKLRAFCLSHEKRREERNRAILENLKKLRMPISFEELYSVGSHVIGRPHIAHLMVQKGYVASTKEAFAQYLAEGGLAYDAGKWVCVEETISMIHQAGGKAFIAHPHLIAKQNILKQLLKLPFDGIECYYASYSPANEKRWLKIAEKRGLLVSGGSDFHGIKPYLSLGSVWVDEERFRKIFQNLC